MKTILLLTLTAISAISGCNKNMGKSQATKSRLDHIEVYLIDQFATPKAEQTGTSMYLADYQIIKPIEMDSSSIAELKNIISDSTTYNGENMKSCPFIGKYGVALSNRDKDYFHVIVSTEACPKCQVFASDTAWAGHFDLVNLNVYSIIGRNLKNH